MTSSRAARGARVVAAAAAMLGAACGAKPVLLPAPQSRAPVLRPMPSDRVLRAGFGRADITPPPGLGLAGFGPEGRRAAGHRQRLYARALVLEDSRGERVAFIVADLGLMAAQLHRLVAAHIEEETGIGADRLVVVGTHTHTGPGNFLDVGTFALLASSVKGYDPRVVAFLDAGFTRAVREAFHHLRPAQVAWGSVAIWGQTRNRSLDAFLLNPAKSRPDFHPPANLDSDFASIDPTWLMLRVDMLGADSRPHPAGALSLFSVHPTVNATSEDLYDPDIFGPLERSLERAIDDSNGVSGAVPRAVHLVANSNHGDVTADWPAASRCDPPRLRPIRRAPGPRAPVPAPEWQSERPSRLEACREAARRYVAAGSRVIQDSVLSLYNRLGGSLNADVQVERAYRNIPLTGALAPHELCESPMFGISLPGGSMPDAPTRLNGWRLLGVFEPPIGESPHAARSPHGCHGAKRRLLPPLQWSLSRFAGGPDFAELMLVRVGTTVLAALPIEVTTVAGEQMRRAVWQGLREHDPGDRVAVISVANGYTDYMATAAEYAAQQYEGSSTLYGPLTAKVFADQLRSMAAHLDSAGQADTAFNLVSPILAHPGAESSLLPDSYQGPSPSEVHRLVLDSSCDRGVLTVDWLDVYPGRLLPWDGPIVRIEHRVSTGGAWTRVTWDDDPLLEVRAIGPERRHGGYRWRMRWRPLAWPAEELRFVLAQRPSVDEVLLDLAGLCGPRP